MYNLLKIFAHEEVYNFPIHFIDELYSALLTFNNATANIEPFWFGVGTKTKSSMKIFISNKVNTTLGVVVTGRWKV